MPIAKLRVFVSSPGDVEEERVRADALLRRLALEFAARAELEPVFWEHEPLVATEGFQTQLPRPSACDLAICVLWARLGTRLPANVTRADGSRYASGTEFEFEDARAGWLAGGRPALWVYRKTAEPRTSLKDTRLARERLEQKEALDAFVERWFHDRDDRSLVAAFHPFETSADFEQRLEQHLRKWLDATLPAATTASRDRLTKTWRAGSPFRGLEVFEREHADVFHGRARAVSDVLDALRRQAASGGGGRAFVLVLGMSGGGKSSLARAGVLPLLTRPGVVEGVGLWRHAILRPADSPGDLFDGLAAALLHPDALPELADDGTDAAALAATLRAAPAAARSLVKGALSQAAAVAAARAGGSQPRPVARLALLVDQLEEVFTRDASTTAERAAFAETLAALAQDGLVWTVATLRSDFYHRCAELPALVALKSGEGQYDLLPPTAGELAQMIRAPAAAAGLTFQAEPGTGRFLDDLLLAEAAPNPEALPLLEFTLEALYQRRGPDDVLTWDAYRELGGLAGAVARRAEEVLSELHESPVFADRSSGTVEDALHRAFRELVAVEVGEGELVVRRTASKATLESTPQGAALVEAFTAARLLTAERPRGSGGGDAVVRIAHEALLRSWPRLGDWIAATKDALRTRARVAAAAARWDEAGRPDDLLLPPGTRFEEAAALVAGGYVAPATAEGVFVGRSGRLIRATLLAAEGRATLERSPRRALLLGAAALRLTEDAGEPRVPAAEEVVRAALQRVGGLALDGRPRDRRYALAVSADGRWLAAGGEGTALTLWDLAAPNPDDARVDLVDLAPAVSLAFSPDGRWLLTGAWRPYGGGWNPRNPRPSKSILERAVDRREWLITGGDSPFHGAWTAEETDQAAVRLWDLAAIGAATAGAHAPRSLGGHEHRVDAVAIGARWLVTGSWDATARAWDLAAADPAADPLVLREHDHAILAVALTADGRRAITGSADGTACVWSLPEREGADGGEVPCVTLGGHEGPVDLLAATADGSRVVTAGRGIARALDPHGVRPRLWDLSGAAPTGVVLELIEDTLDRVAISPDGRWLAAWGEWAYATLTDLHAPDPTTSCAILPAIGGPVRVVAFSPEGDRLLTAAGYAADEQAEASTPEHVARVWTLSGESLPAVRDQDDARYLVMDPDESVALDHGDVILDAAVLSSDVAITAGADGVVCVWDPSEQGKSMRRLTLRGHEDGVYRVAAVADGSALVTASADGTVRRWELASLLAGGASASPRALVPVEPSLGPVVSPNGERAFAAFGQVSVLWAMGAAEPATTTARLPLAEGIAVSRARFSADGTRLATGVGDTALVVWTLPDDDPTPPLVLTGLGPTIYQVLFSPDARWLAVESGEEVHPPKKKLRLFDLRAEQPAEPARVIEGHDGGGAILASLFSPDGRWLATAGEDGTVRLHPLDSLGAGDAAGIVLRDEESPVSLEFSPDGRWLITGGPGSAFERQLTVRLWDLTAPDVAASARALRGHETGIDLVASSPGGRWLLTSAGGDRGGVRLWDLRADDPTACAVVLPGEPLRFPIVRFSPDDRWLFTSSYQRTPQLWDLARADPGAAPVALRGHVFPRVTASVSADSRWLVTADGDLEAPKRAGQSCRVWELAARDVGASAALVPVEQGGATRMATVGDRWLLTAGAPGVRLWHLGVRALLDVARRAAGGELRAEEVREVWEARGR